MASLFETRTLAPLLQLTTTQIPTLEDLVPVVKLLKDDMVTDNMETMETVRQAGQDFKNGSWLGQVVLVDFS
jgi:hypothetical protein